MTGLSSIASNQYEPLLISGENDEVFWFPPQQTQSAFPFEEIEQQEYRRLTNLSSAAPTAAKFKDQRKSESMSDGDKLALGTIVIGGAFLLGGIPGVAVILLAGCYGLRDIGSPGNEEENQNNFEPVPDAAIEMQAEPPEPDQEEAPVKKPVQWSQIEFARQGSQVFCGLTTTGNMICDRWRFNENLPDRFQQISIRGDYACGLTEDGEIKCTDGDTNGFILTGEPYINISAGGFIFCALNFDNRVDCIDQPPWSKTFIDSPEINFQFIDTANETACGIRESDQKIECWGRPEFFRPEDFNVSDGQFLQISHGEWFGCGVKTDNTIECWRIYLPEGNNYGQLVPPSPNEGFTQVSVASDHVCAIKADSIICWGRNDEGQAPSEVPGSFIDLATGFRTTCAVTEEGEIECWGRLRFEPKF